MNIKSRLRQIERKVIKPITKFCPCYGENLKYEVIPITIDEWKRRFHTGEERQERLPDVCERCGKPLDKSQIEISFEEMIETQQRRINELNERMRSYEDN